jgi:hypothetical protein
VHAGLLAGSTGLVTALAAVVLPSVKRGRKRLFPSNAARLQRQLK